MNSSSRRRFVFFTSSILILNGGESLAQSFEGVIAFKVTSQGKQQELKYYTKADEIRMEVEGVQTGMGAVLMNTKSRTMTMLMPQNKAYMEMKFDDMQMPPEAQSQEMDIQKTGKQETILGYTCDQIILTREGGSAEIWATKGLGKFIQMSMGPRNQSPAMKKLEKELTEQGYFPLRMKSNRADGSEEMRMEASSVEKRTLSKDLFSIPGDFQKMQVPQMPRQ